MRNLSHSHARARGFTIVELLIVIVVIAILATITIVAFNGVQGRARDSQRLADMKAIQKALELYKTTNGSYPSTTSTTNAAGWEVTTNGTTATSFLNSLVTSKTMSKVPVDPTNTGDGSAASSLNPSRSSTNYLYFYYLYPAGTGGCDTARGPFYILGVTRMDTISSGTSHPQSPGFVCPSRDWVNSGAYVSGGYTN